MALEAIRELKTLNEIASEYGVHPNLVREWKKQVLSELPGIFTSTKESDIQEREAEKKLVWSVEQKRAAIEVEEPRLSLRRQCDLLGMSRGSWYSQLAGESAENLRLMRLLDEQYTKTPFYGVKRMTAWLQREGEEVNEKRIRRLLRTMGLLAIYPGPKTSQPDAEHRMYPYLLRGMAITRPNVV